MTAGGPNGAPGSAAHRAGVIGDTLCAVAPDGKAGDARRNAPAPVVEQTASSNHRRGLWQCAAGPVAPGGVEQVPDWMLYEAMFHQRDPAPGILEQEHSDHRALVDAVAAHDAELAERRARDHLQNVSEELVALLQIPVSLLREKEHEIWRFLVDR